MEAKLTRLTHKIMIQLQLVWKLLDTPLYGMKLSTENLFIQSTNTIYGLVNTAQFLSACLEGALGGGSELAMACDFRLLTSDTGGIGFVHSHMGITPAWGGCTRLVHTIGYTKALDLLTTGRRVSGEEALHIGLADGIVHTENSLTEASEWLKVRIMCDVEVLKSLKTMVHNAKELSYQGSLSEEKRLFAPLWGGPANQAALAQNIKHK
jgi:enoyl-CoA hydratase/carnithine racemase